MGAAKRLGVDLKTADTNDRSKLQAALLVSAQTARYAPRNLPLEK